MDSHLRALLISGTHTMWIVTTRIYNCPMSVATTSSAPPQELHSWAPHLGLRSSGRDTPSSFIPNSAPLAPPQPSCFLPGSLRFFLMLLLGMSNLLLLLVEVWPMIYVPPEFIVQVPIPVPSMWACLEIPLLQIWLDKLGGGPNSIKLVSLFFFKKAYLDTQTHTHRMPCEHEDRN